MDPKRARCRYNRYTASMAPPLFDTLLYFEKLRAAGVPESQAKAWVTALAEALAEAFGISPTATAGVKVAAPDADAKPESH